MKLTFQFILLISLSSCGLTNRFESSSDYAIDGQFERYVTYDVVNNNGLSIDQNAAIAKGINLQLGALGFSPSVDQPSLYVYYQLYIERFEFMSLEQPSLDNWLVIKDYQAIEATEGWRSVNRKSVGQTLMIVLFDPLLGQEVWKGSISRPTFSSGYDYQSAAQAVLYRHMILTRDLGKPSHIPVD
ncbi:MAG: DUF4136 domain-containing protein [Cyclobacteriaceae bacterium]